MRGDARAAYGVLPQTVLVFATGGTIGMRRTEHGLAPDPGFPDELERVVSKATWYMLPKVSASSSFAIALTFGPAASSSIA